MCAGCFASQWVDDRDDGPLSVALTGFITSTPLPRFYEMARVLALLQRPPSVPGWVSGPLHAAVNNDNYDCGCYPSTPEARREWDAEHRGRGANGPTADQQDEMCAAWDGLTDDERAMVVAWFSGDYDLVGMTTGAYDYWENE